METSLGFTSLTRAFLYTCSRWKGAEELGLNLTLIRQDRTPMSDFDTVPVHDIPADAVILDVREDYEWVAGHADGALHIPMDQIPARLGELDPDEDLYVICRTGGRSFRVAQWLTGQGYTAINVSGGMDQWLEAGKPLVSDNGLKPLVL